MAKMATAKPANKVVGGSIGTAVGTILVWFLADQGIADLPAAVEAAIVVVVTFAFGYFVPPGKADTTVD